MTGRYLLDTNILSHLVRDPRGRVARKIEEVGQALVCTSIIVTSELRYGVTKRGSSRLATQLSVIIERLEVLPFETPADMHYGNLRTHLERLGSPIGPNDLLIAAQALSLGHVLVTDNEREFSRIPGLQIENWLRPALN